MDEVNGSGGAFTGKDINIKPKQKLSELSISELDIVNEYLHQELKSSQSDEKTTVTYMRICKVCEESTKRIDNIDWDN